MKSVKLNGMVTIMFSFLILCAFSQNENNKNAEIPKYRTVILTDMTHDDGNSLIRFLYYAPFFDLEAMIVTNQLPDFYADDPQPWNKAMTILEAYKEELPQLQKHDTEFPGYEELLSVTKKGHGALPIIWLTNSLTFADNIADRYVESQWDSIYFDDWIGEGTNPAGLSKDSEGSDFLVEVFEKDDDRPVYVQAWGGTITFVQALYRYRKKHSEEDFQKLLDKIHLFGILFQDISFEYFADFDALEKHSCPNHGTAISTYNGEPVQLGMVLFDPSHFWHYCCSGDPDWDKPMLASEVNGHGPMSELYDSGGEGDTPSFLYLLSAVYGLNNPSKPTQGRWGSMFSKIGGPFPEGYYHTCDNSQNELLRWVPAAKRSFQNRLLWSIKDPEEVNNIPVAVVNGHASHEVLKINAKPGEIIELDASDSYDPDDNILHFNWFHYNEADDSGGTIQINDSKSSEIEFTLPEPSNGEIHIVLELSDNGSPALTSYKRIIISNHSQ